VPQKAWTIQPYGDNVLPYFVYVRYRDAAGEWVPSGQNPPFPASIIYDPVEPRSFLQDAAVQANALEGLLATNGLVPVLVEWGGDDGTDGSGVWRYNIMVMDEADGQWKPWLVQTEQTSAEFQGEPGHTYHFRVRAQDRAHNWEPVKDDDLTITIPSTCAVVGDFDGNGVVDVADVMEIAGRWRQFAGSPYDLDGDDKVTIADIMRVAAAWGPCP